MAHVFSEESAAPAPCSALDKILHRAAKNAHIFLDKHIVPPYFSLLVIQLMIFWM
jgi:hypothetical protein